MANRKFNDRQNGQAGDMDTPAPFEYAITGFQSPAQDFSEDRLDLNRLMIQNPHTTFFSWATNDVMKGLGIDNGTLLIIDKSVDPFDGCLAVCYIDGEFLIRTLQYSNGAIILLPANDKYEPITISEGNELLIWGVVIWTARKQ